jgi:hypothetical protein
MKARPLRPRSDPMNDSLIGLAFATLFGVAMLVVGWQLRNVFFYREYEKFMERNWSRDNSDEATGIG